METNIELFQSLMNRHAAFSDATFIGEGYETGLLKLKDEADEAMMKPELVEYADMLLCLMNSFRHVHGTDVTKFLQVQSTWNFARTYRGPLMQLQFYADETMKNPTLENYIRIYQSLLNSFAYVHGYDWKHLLQAAMGKVAINEKRTWKRNDNGTYSHVKNT